MTQEKKQVKKRIQLVDVVHERKGSQLFEGRRICPLQETANIIHRFIGIAIVEDYKKKIWAKITNSLDIRLNCMGK